MVPLDRRPLIEKGRRRPLGFDWKIWFDSLEVELIYAKAVISNLEALEGKRGQVVHWLCAAELGSMRVSLRELGCLARRSAKLGSGVARQRRRLAELAWGVSLAHWSCSCKKEAEWCAGYEPSSS